MYPFKFMFLFSLGKQPELELLDHIIFWGPTILLWLHQFSQQQCTRVFFSFKSSPTLVISCLSDNSCSNRCEVVPHSGFDLHFPDDKWCWVSFHVPVGHLYVFYGKMPIQILCPFLNWFFFWQGGCWVEWVLCIFWILTPDQIYIFANIFFFSVGCHFILLMISFTVQKLFSLM